MAIDAEKKVIEQQNMEIAEQSAPELSIEEQAKAVGWREDGPDSAEMFLRTKPLYDAIKERGKESKELKATVKELQAHLSKLESVAYEKAMRELKAERRAAISTGDVTAVEKLDAEMEQIRTASPISDDAKAEAEAFVERNKSWINDPSMESEAIRTWVAKRDAELMRFNLKPKEHMELLESEMRKTFKMDEAVEPPKYAAVESEQNSVSVKSKRKMSFNDLNKEQKDICRHFEKRGVMKAEEYIKQLQELGEL